MQIQQTFKFFSGRFTLFSIVYTVWPESRQSPPFECLSSVQLLQMHDNGDDWYCHLPGVIQCRLSCKVTRVTQTLKSTNWLSYQNKIQYNMPSVKAAHLETFLFFKFCLSKWWISKHDTIFCSTVSSLKSYLSYWSPLKRASLIFMTLISFFYYFHESCKTNSLTICWTNTVCNFIGIPCNVLWRHFPSIFHLYSPICTFCLWNLA